MAEKQVFTFPSADGQSTIHAVRWLPDDGAVSAVLQITHGMVEYIERYTPFAEYLTTKGFAVVGHDHIGHGDSVKDPSEWGVMHAEDPSDIMIADMLKNYELAKEQWPDVPFFALGHSMGSYMLRKYLSVYADKLSGLSGAIIMGTGSVPDGTVNLGKNIIKLIARFKGWDYRSKFVAGLMFGGPYKRYDLTGGDPTNSWLTKNPLIVEKYYSDPKCTYLFTLRAYYGLLSSCGFDNDPQGVAAIPKSLPILFVSGSDDPVGDNGAGVKTAYNLFKSAGISDVTIRLFEGDRHEVLNETDCEKVFGELYDWMKVHA